MPSGSGLDIFTWSGQINTPIFFNSENDLIIGSANLKNLFVTTPYFILFLSKKLINEPIPSNNLQPLVKLRLYSVKNSDLSDSNFESYSLILKKILINFDVPSDICGLISDILILFISYFCSILFSEN